MKSNIKKHIHILVFFIPLILSFTTWFQMELSCNYKDIFNCFHMETSYILLNILTELTFIMLIYILSNKIWLSSLVYSIISAIVSLVNYYVVTLKGMPLSILEIKNFKTAMNVIGSYDLEINTRVIYIVLITVLNILLSLTAKKIEPQKNNNIRFILAKNLIIASLGTIVLYFGYFSPNPIKPKKVVGWSWTEAYSQYGYMACSIELIESVSNAIEKPKGYSEEIVASIPLSNGSVGHETPDIILILNETFYDLNQITDLQTDVPVLENINSIDNVIRGYTIVPAAGGGTNSSEYELLTSNSLQLGKGITPFNVLNMNNANSIVSHLKKLGYYTTGAHSETGNNYSRARGYEGLGFDSIYFDNQFLNKEYYADRYFETDASLYQNLISWYEEQILSDNPQFMYLLTMQNHGGWELNDSKYDTVHALNDFGDYQEQVNEYLTSIKMSDEAFKILTDYFSTIDRPVIVCMLGDHSPSFAANLTDDSVYWLDNYFRLRATPFVIWANYDIEDSDMGYISLNQVVPTILETGNIKTSPYYQYLIDLRKDVPVISSCDFYTDKDGTQYYYYTEKDSPFYEEVKNYFYLEYNNLQNDKLQNIFEPYND